MSIYAVETGTEYAGIYSSVLFFTLEEARKYVKHRISSDSRTGWKNKSDNVWKAGCDYIVIEEVEVYETSEKYIQKEAVR